MTNAMTAGLPPVHPGDVLKEDILPAVKATRTEIAGRPGVSRQTLYGLLNGETPVSSLLAQARAAVWRVGGDMVQSPA